jgi:transcriptional regulator with XRE-family HTH domain
MNLFKKRRLDLKMTQKEVASLANVTEDYILRIEHNKRNPHRNTEIMLCRALKLNPDTLEPIKKSAFDELKAIDLIGVNLQDCFEMSKWTEKYEFELKQIQAKESESGLRND